MTQLLCRARTDVNINGYGAIKANEYIEVTPEIATALRAGVQANLLSVVFADKEPAEPDATDVSGRFIGTAINATTEPRIGGRYWSEAQAKLTPGERLILCGDEAFRGVRNVNNHKRVPFGVEPQGEAAKAVHQRCMAIAEVLIAGARKRWQAAKEQSEADMKWLQDEPRRQLEKLREEVQEKEREVATWRAQLDKATNAVQAGEHALALETVRSVIPEPPVPELKEQPNYSAAEMLAH